MGLTDKANRPSRKPDDGGGRERRNDHGSLGDSCGWVRVERVVRAATVWFALKRLRFPFRFLLHKLQDPFA